MLKRSLALIIIFSVWFTGVSSSCAQTAQALKTLYVVVLGGIAYFESGSFAAAKEKQQEIPGSAIEQIRESEDSSGSSDNGNDDGD